MTKGFEVIFLDFSDGTNVITRILIRRGKNIKIREKVNDKESGIEMHFGWGEKGTES
jgi:hypothetical protein